MNALSAVLREPLLEQLGWMLVHSVWQCAAAAIVLAVTLRVLRRSETRYLTGCAALLGCVGCMAITFAMIQPAPQTQIIPRIGEPVSPILSLAPSLDPIPLSTQPQPTPSTPFPLSLAAVIWLSGVVMLCARHVMGWMSLRRLRHRSRWITDRPTLARLHAIMQRLGISRKVELAESARVQVPSMIGHLRPLILLPIGAIANLSPMHLDAILAHELAHIRRHDYLANLLQTLIETLLFYHPAVWWISTSIRQEREHCCDDIAVRIVGNAREYGAALAAMEELRLPAELAMAAGGGSLLKRIQRLVKPEPRRGMVAPALLAIAVVLGVAACGHMTQSKTQAQEPSTQPIAASDSNLVRTSNDPDEPVTNRDLVLRTLQSTRVNALAKHDAKREEITNFQKANPTLSLRPVYDQQLSEISARNTEAQLRRLQLEASLGADHPTAQQARAQLQSTAQLYASILQTVLSLNVKEAELQRLTAELEQSAVLIDRLNQRIEQVTMAAQAEPPATRPNFNPADYIDVGPLELDRLTLEQRRAVAAERQRRLQQQRRPATTQAQSSVSPVDASSPFAGLGDGVRLEQTPQERIRRPNAEQPLVFTGYGSVGTIQNGTFVQDGTPQQGALAGNRVPTDTTTWGGGTLTVRSDPNMVLRVLGSALINARIDTAEAEASFAATSPVVTQKQDLTRRLATRFAEVSASASATEQASAAEEQMRLVSARVIEVELQLLDAQSKVGPDHPTLTKLQRQLELLKRMLNEQLVNLRVLKQRQSDPATQP